MGVPARSHHRARTSKLRENLANEELRRNSVAARNTVAPFILHRCADDQLARSSFAFHPPTRLS